VRSLLFCTPSQQSNHRAQVRRWLRKFQEPDLQSSRGAAELCPDNEVL